MSDDCETCGGLGFIFHTVNREQRIQVPCPKCGQARALAWFLEGKTPLCRPLETREQTEDFISRRDDENHQTSN